MNLTVLLNYSLLILQREPFLQALLETLVHSAICLTRWHNQRKLQLIKGGPESGTVAFLNKVIKCNFHVNFHICFGKLKICNFNIFCLYKYLKNDGVGGGCEI